MMVRVDSAVGGEPVFINPEHVAAMGPGDQPGTAAVFLATGHQLVLGLAPLDLERALLGPWKAES